jgi:hypothetical protein
MADAYELPEDLGTLSDEDIEQHLTAAAIEMKKIATSNTATAKTVPALKGLRDTIFRLQGEQNARLAAAAETAAEIDALMAETFGEDETAEAAAETTEAAAETTEAAAETAETETKVIEPTAVISASARRSMNLAAARAKQSGTGTGLSRYLPSEATAEIEIVASVDVPGYRPGQSINLDQITEGAMRRATGLKTAGGGTGIIASYRLPFPDDLTVSDSSSASEGSTALMVAADQRRLNGQDLVASGGWCAPSETLYDILDIACPDMLWDAPEVQLNRGGLRFFRTPTLDVAALTFVWTEAQDIAAATQPAGPEKPCYQIPCPAPIDVRAEAVGVCLSVGILTQRFFPEMVDWYVRNAMVAHEIRVKQVMYQAALDSAATQEVTIRDSFAAFSAIYEAVALQAADMIERHNLCDSTQLEVTFPWWSKNLMLTDLARQEGVDVATLSVADIQAAFSNLGVRVQWARGLPPAVPTSIGGVTPATTWPTTIQFLIYPSGNFQIGRGPEVNLGVIIDSVTVATNDEKIFSEEPVVLIDRMGLARAVTVEVCPNGEVGARNALDICPTIPAP